MKLHFIGIGGEGMSGVAKLALSLGHQVSGSELVAKRSLNELAHLGVTIYRSHQPTNVVGAELVIRSSAISLDHLEVKTALESGTPVIKRSQALERLLLEKGVRTIAIAGTHGKSTTTAMLGQVFVKAGLDPTVIVGAYVPQFKSHARIGQGQFAIVEADEFDRSFLDLTPESGIVTSIRIDHLDYYRRGLIEIVEAYSAFVDSFAPQGLLVACIDEPAVSERLLRRTRARFQTYGFAKADWQVIPSLGSLRSFEILSHEGMESFELGAPGLHNIQNASAVVALAREYNIGVEAIREALKAYGGIHRRYEKLIVKDNLVYIDDFGHLPHEIETVIRTIRHEFPEWRLLCVPCLRQYHRTKRRLLEFAQALAQADQCIVGPISPGLGDNADTVNSIAPEYLAAAIQRFGCTAVGVRTKKELVDTVLTFSQQYLQASKLVLLTIGTGPGNMNIITDPIRRRIKRL